MLMLLLVLKPCRLIVCIIATRKIEGTPSVINGRRYKHTMYIYYTHCFVVGIVSALHRDERYIFGVPHKYLSPSCRIQHTSTLGIGVNWYMCVPYQHQLGHL